MVTTSTRRPQPRGLPLLLFAMLLAAQAQAQSAKTTRPDPLDPKAPVPAVRYTSSFAKIHPSGEDKPVAWREANDAVARIGGWKAYAREAQETDPAAVQRPTAPGQRPAAAPPPTVPPLSAGHPGHKH